jgi:hypothetical protein
VKDKQELTMRYRQHRRSAPRPTAIHAERLERRQLLSGTLSITPTLAPAALLKGLLGNNTGIAVTSVHLSALHNSTADSTGTFTNSGSVFGLGSTGIVMSTGDVSQYTAPAPSGANTSTDFGTKATANQESLLTPISGNQTTHFDVTELDLTFNMPPTLGQVFFNVVFGSREFPQFVNSEFIDAFGLFLNGTDIAQVNGNPVNIHHPDFHADSTTALPGLLSPDNNPLLTFSAFVGAGSRNNKLTFIIADTSDGVLDTTAYISALGALPPNPNIPTTTVNAPDVTAPAATATFTVTYTDKNIPIQLSSIDSSDLIVTGPNGYSQPATFVSADQTTDGSPITATYSIPGPNGGFTVADDGTYDIAMQFQQVQDTSGDFVPEGVIGTVGVKIAGVTLSAPPTFNAGTSTYHFNVEFIIPDGLRTTSIDNHDILVTNTAAGFSQSAKRVSVSSNGGGHFTATYSLTAPNGKKWAQTDAGNYTFDLQANQVFDVKNNAVPAQTLGTVALTPFGGLSAPPAAEIPSTAAVAVAGDAFGRQFMAFFDPITQSLKFQARMPNGAVSPFRVIDASPGAGARVSLALKNNMPFVAYYNFTSQQMKFAQLVAGSWHTTVVDTGGTVFPDGGQNLSLAFDASGNAVISYYDASNGDLKFARQNGKGFDVETIDSAGNVGAISSIALNPTTGRIEIAYFDAANGRLKLAAEGATAGAFTTTTIPGVVPSFDRLSLAFNSAGDASIGFLTETAGSGTSSVDVVQLSSGTWSTVEHFPLVGFFSGDLSIQLLAPAGAALPDVLFTDASVGQLLFGQHTTSGDTVTPLFNDAGAIAAASLGNSGKFDVLTQPTSGGYSLLLLEDLAAPAAASTVTAITNQSIPGTTEVQGAGNAGLPDPGGSAPVSFNIPSGASLLDFTSVAGSISLAAGGSNDADGAILSGSYSMTVPGQTQISAFGGISGIAFPGAGALLGVFEGATAPTGPGPLDQNLNAGDVAQTGFAPALNQVFFIGDGLSGHGTGAIQDFAIPTGATRLLLGFADAVGLDGPPAGYADNTGSLTVSLEFKV